MEEQIRLAVTELLDLAGLSSGDLLVVGCSTSEIAGASIGKQGSTELAKELLRGLLPVLQEREISLAAQCCEHLNRALVLERAVAKARGYEVVSARPRPHAGGSFAAAVWEACSDPVLVETVSAEAGLDIGDTLIGMHLKRVAVPVRLSVGQIGKAHLTVARTRPKYIGGSRAEYLTDER